MGIETAQSLNIQRLYHYQSFKKPERLAQIFTDQKLYCSALEHLNDPWDCRPFFRTSGLGDAAERERVIRWLMNADRKLNACLPEVDRRNREERLRSDRSFLEGQVDRITVQTYESFKKQYRVYCLSKNPDSTLMWAHYSDSCRGVCLEFSAQTNFFGQALQVEYLDAYPHIDIAETDPLENAKPFITKSAAWDYEGEFRILVTQHPYAYGSIPVTLDGFISLSQGTLQSVILGPLMPPENKQLIRKLANGAGWNVRVKEAVLLRDRYGFEIRDIKRDSSSAG